MATLEQLRQQKQELDAKRKAIAKAVAKMEKAEAAKLAKEQREKEIADALEFVKYCKENVMPASIGIMKRVTIWDYVMNARKQTGMELPQEPSHCSTGYGMGLRY